MTSVGTAPQKQYEVHYKTARISDLDIFYREARSKRCTRDPACCMDFPTSSNMFRNLIPRLAGSFHLIAPDYPGYGQSSMPDHKSFAYTFDNYAKDRGPTGPASRNRQVLSLLDGLRRAHRLPAGTTPS